MLLKLTLRCFPVVNLRRALRRRVRVAYPQFFADCKTPGRKRRIVWFADAADFHLLSPFFAMSVRSSSARSIWLSKYRSSYFCNNLRGLRAIFRARRRSIFACRLLRELAWLSSLAGTASSWESVASVDIEASFVAVFSASKRLDTGTGCKICCATFGALSSWPVWYFNPFTLCCRSRRAGTFMLFFPRV